MKDIRKWSKKKTGGSSGQLINIEKNEILVDPNTLQILDTYFNAPKHPKDGSMNPEGHRMIPKKVLDKHTPFVIPANKTKSFLSGTEDNARKIISKLPGYRQWKRSIKMQEGGSVDPTSPISIDAFEPTQEFYQGLMPKFGNITPVSKSTQTLTQQPAATTNVITSTTASPTVIKTIDGINDYSGMTFRDAFSKARTEAGNDKGTFYWTDEDGNKTLYGTQYSSEAKIAGTKQWVDLTTGDIIKNDETGNEGSKVLNAKKTTNTEVKTTINDNTKPIIKSSLTNVSDTLPKPKTFDKVKRDTSSNGMEIQSTLTSPIKLDTNAIIKAKDTIDDYLNTQPPDHQLTEEDYDKLNTLTNIPKAYLAWYVTSRTPTAYKDVTSLMAKGYAKWKGTASPISTGKGQFSVAFPKKGLNKVLLGKNMAGEALNKTKGLNIVAEGYKKLVGDPLLREIKWQRYVPGYDVYRVGKGSLNLGTKGYYKAANLLEKAGTGITDMYSSTKTGVSSLIDKATAINYGKYIPKASSVSKSALNIGKTILSDAIPTIFEIANKGATGLQAFEILTSSGADPRRMFDVVKKRALASTTTKEGYLENLKQEYSNIDLTSSEGNALQSLIAKELENPTVGIKPIGRQNLSTITPSKYKDMLLFSHSIKTDKEEGKTEVQITQEKIKNIMALPEFQRNQKLNEYILNDGKLTGVPEYDKLLSERITVLNETYNKMFHPKKEEVSTFFNIGEKVAVNRLFENPKDSASVFERQMKDVTRYGKFMSGSEEIQNRTDYDRLDASKDYIKTLLANSENNNNIIIDIGSALGNPDDKLAGSTVKALYDDNTISSKSTIIATDIPSEMAVWNKKKTKYDIIAEEVPLSFTYPIDKLIDKYGDKYTNNVILRAANSIDLLMTTDELYAHLKDVASKTKEYNVTYLFNKDILQKIKNSETFVKVGELDNKGFNHQYAEWKNK